MNSSLKMVVVLGLIAFISAGLLAGVNYWTAPIIEENAQARLNATFSRVIDADEFVEPEEETEFFLRIAKKGGAVVGYVVRLTGQGYSSAGIDILVGLNTEAEVQGVYIFSHSETPGLGDRITDPAWLSQFKGKGIDDPIASGTDVDAISGATSSSTAVIGSVRRAVQFVGGYLGLIEETEIDFAQIPDGTYTGTGRGFGGDVTVEVTFANGELTKVVIVSHNETAGVSDPAIEAIPKAMVAEQKIQVDTVSGATMTSEAIIAAVKDALKEFGGAGPAEPIDIGSLLPGTYTGSAKGLKDDITVEVTVSGGRITKIVVLSHDDTPEYAEPAFAFMIDQIIETQDLEEVDFYSGATFSSEGLLNAVKNALRSQVKLDISGLPDGVYVGEGEGFHGITRVSFRMVSGELKDLEVLEHNDTPEYANKAFATLIPAITEAQSLEVDLASGATFSSQGLLDAIMDAIKKGPVLDVSQVPDGVYSGTGEGLFGGLQVEVTVSGGKITDIVVVDHQDTPEYASLAIDGITKAILDTQSLDVDVVSGATGTSRGLLEAIEAALKSAVQ
ncbi:MAG: FMN-binding protein [Firmicutes bacterium]|nr:FMN-binding protein [Bacillota bacterium]HOB35567.1 FMN-binding protein [Bacillota bacterium]HPZ91429.1 FMN-binding protein [Bacillota bacterium]HQE02181.1 FMN-binding protein [Bacillota bacterium]